MTRIHYLSIVLSLYYIVLLIVSVIAARRTKTVSDYILAGRHLHGAVAALGVGASDMSGWLLMGMPGAIYLAGFSQLWMPVGLVIGAYLNWQFVAKRLRIFSEEIGDTLTIPAYLSARFDDQKSYLKIVTAIIILVFFTLYASAGFVASTIIFQQIFHTSYAFGLFLTVTSIVIYTSIGGFLAVNWVDFFQGSLMLLALIIVPAVTYFHLSPSMHDLSTAAFPQLSHIDLTWGKLANISLLFWGLGYFGQPHILVRFMAMSKPQDASLAKNICMSWMVLSLIGAIFVGLLGKLYFASSGIENHESIFLVLSNQLFPAVLEGLLVSAVLSAVMSTISAQLLASSSSLVEDLFGRVLKRKVSSYGMVWLSRLGVVIIGLCAMWLAKDSNATVLTLVGYAWAGLGSAFGPVILLSLWWKRVSYQAVICGMLSGAITVLVWISLESLGGVFTLYSLLPGFLAGSLVVILVSKIKPAQQTVQNLFDTANNVSLNN